MTFISRRLIGALIAIAGAITLVFFALRATPGDPADNILGDEAPESAKIEFRSRLHLDKPLTVQYGFLWRDIANGTLGISYEVSDRRRTS